MDKEKIKKALEELKKDSKKRNFTQSVDLVINLKNLDLKKPENHVDTYLTLPHEKGKKMKICALVGPELEDEAKKTCDKVISAGEFEKYKNEQKLAKKLASEYDFFVAQANIMAQVAGAFGKVLGSRKKMPNPKAGCVVPPKFAMKPLYDKLQKTIRLLAKDKPLIQVSIGTDKSTDDHLIENAMAAYETLIHSLPGEANNIKNIYLKFTMSKPVKVE